MLQTRKTTNAALIHAYQACERNLCRPLLADIEDRAQVWAMDADRYPEIKKLLFDGIDALSVENPDVAMDIALKALDEVSYSHVKAPLFDTLYSLVKQSTAVARKVSLYESMIGLLDKDDALLQGRKVGVYTDWVDAVKRLPNAQSRLDAVKRAVGFSRDEESGEITLARSDEAIRNSASLIIMDSLAMLDDEDAVPTILDLSAVSVQGSPAHRDMIENAVLKLNTLDDGEDRVHYASIIMDATQNSLIQNKAAVSILENIDALPHSSNKLSLLIKVAMTFEPRCELERKSALKWAEVAIQTRLRTSVSMEDIMTEAMQASDESFLKEQALQLAISLSAVLLKQQWMSEREKGIRLALAALPFTKDIARLRDKAVDILLDNSDAVTKAKERAHFVYDVLGFVSAGSMQAQKGIEVLLEASENLTSTTRMKPGEPSENDIRLAYMYRAASLVADDADNEQVVIQNWLSALKALPTRKEQLRHLVHCLKQTSRNRLLYTIAWENYDRLSKQERTEQGGAAQQTEEQSGEGADQNGKKPLLKVVGE